MERQFKALDRQARKSGGVRRAATPRRSSGAFVPGLVISGILAGAVMLHDPGMTGYRLHQLIDHLTGNDAGSYAFVTTTTNGDPVGWNHCQAIHYVVNPAGAPDDWEDIIRGGVDTVTDAKDTLVPLPAGWEAHELVATAKDALGSVQRFRVIVGAREDGDEAVILASLYVSETLARAAPGFYSAMFASIRGL